MFGGKTGENVVQGQIERVSLANVSLDIRVSFQQYLMLDSCLITKPSTNEVHVHVAMAQFTCTLAVHG